MGLFSNSNKENEQKFLEGMRLLVEDNKKVSQSILETLSAVKDSNNYILEYLRKNPTNNDINAIRLSLELGVWIARNMNVNLKDESLTLEELKKQFQGKYEERHITK